MFPAAGDRNPQCVLFSLAYAAERSLNHSRLWYEQIRRQYGEEAQKKCDEHANLATGERSDGCGALQDTRTKAATRGGIGVTGWS